LLDETQFLISRQEKTGCFDGIDESNVDKADGTAIEADKAEDDDTGVSNISNNFDAFKGIV
jgi:hypothetical protein